ncbi:MAG: hypothetical protein VZR53_07205 [Prevotella sp.]|nr:hypothetical protein [Prevotella sp.]
MINYLVSILVSLGFWGKATQETEEKTEKSSWLRTFIYGVLTVVVCVLFYKTYQPQQSVWNIFALQAKGAYNEKGESLDSLSIILRKYVSAHDSVWMKWHNDDFYSSGVFLKYTCSNDSNAVYKFKRNNGEYFPLDILGDYLETNLPNDSMPGYKAIKKVRKDMDNPGPMQDILHKYYNGIKLEAWEKHSLHSYEDSLYGDIAAAYKAFFLISKPESLIPYMIKSEEINPQGAKYPLIESIKQIDKEAINNTGLFLKFLNGDRMTEKEAIFFLKESGLMNGDLYEVTSFTPKYIVKNMPKDIRFVNGYFANSEEYSSDFFSAFDLSQSTQSIHINSEIPIGILQVMFDVPIELVGSNPQPDYISTTGIGFKDPEKTKIIQKEGVNFHVKFPTMENKQLIRSLILTTILTATLSLFLSNLYYCFRKFILSIKIKNNIVIPQNFQYLINALIIAIMLYLVYYSFLLVFKEKILINEADIWYYVTMSIIILLGLISFIIYMYKKMK